MRRFENVWLRVGAIPALGVVGSFFGLVLLAALVLEGSTAAWVGGTLFAFLVVYCLARPRGGWDVFATAAAPGAASTLLHDIAGTPRWLGLFLIPVALLLAWGEDRPAHSTERRDQSDRPSGPTVENLKKV
jgi:hypothetical protein